VPDMLRSPMGQLQPLTPEGLRGAGTRWKAALPQARWKRLVVLVVAGGALLFALMQAVPYGRSHHNPPVRAEPAWDSPRTLALAADACFDCHSNLTTWPWDSNIAPFSWLIQRDVESGRAALNFSDWRSPQDGAFDAAEATRSGSMPPWYYKLMHPKSRLTLSERDALAQGLQRTIAKSPPPGGAG
jgi:mono/diheme cytochrome c family protein